MTGRCSSRRCRRSAWRAPGASWAHSLDEARARPRRDRPAVRPPAQLHPRRLGRRDRLQPRRIRPDGRLRDRGNLRRSSRSWWRRASSAGKSTRMEVMPRRGRQRRHRLLDPENFDPDGRPHRRQHHRRPGPDAHRQGIPADASDASLAILRKIGVETGGSNVQFAVDPAYRGVWIVIEMNPPGEPLYALASKERHRVPDREDCRQAGRRVHPGRDPQRHHARDARVLRADDRLRRHQDPPLGLREVPRGRPGPHHADEISR